MKLIILLIPILLLLLLQGCVTGGSSSPAAVKSSVTTAMLMRPDPEYANVYIRRYPVFKGSGAKMSIFVSGEWVGDLSHNTYMNVKLTPETHLIRFFDTSGKYSFSKGDVILIQCTYGVLEKGEVKNIIGVSFNSKTQDVQPCWVEKDINIIRSILKEDTLVQSSKKIYATKGYLEYIEAELLDTIDSYRSFLDKYSKTPFASQAKIILKEKRNSKKQAERKSTWDRYIKNQKCSLHHKNWVYVSDNCNGDVANGIGSAISSDLAYSFSGVIKNGKFFTGKFLVNGRVVYDGEFKNGIPEGNGQCSFNNKSEPCTFRDGNRVDNIYKERQELNRLKNLQRNM